jgi:hypothetical protein
MMDRTRLFLWVAIGVLVVVCIALAVIAFTSDGNCPPTALGVAPTNSVNVKDYGAVGDGVADDGPAIVKAAADAAGRIVYFPSGSYYVANVAILPAGWPSGWKGDGGAGNASFIKSVVTAGAGKTAWDFRWIAP